MGELLHWAAQVVAELTNPEQVYVSLWLHAGGRPGHIHYVVQPVDRESMEKYRSHGPKLQVAMFEHGDPPDPVAVQQFTDRVRELWAAPSAQAVT